MDKIRMIELLERNIDLMNDMTEEERARHRDKIHDLDEIRGRDQDILMRLKHEE